MDTLGVMNIAVASITIFRFLMYLFALEMNTRTKFSAESWLSEEIKEVAYEWTRALRLMFTFRLMVTFVVVYGADPLTNWLFLLATLIFNLLFLLNIFGLTGGAGIGKGKVVQPHNITIPKVLTWLDFLMPLGCVGYLLVVGI